MLRAECEGRPFSPPPPSAVPRFSSGPSSRASPAGSGANSRNASQAKNLDDWGDWDNDKVRTVEFGDSFPHHCLAHRRFHN